MSNQTSPDPASIARQFLAERHAAEARYGKTVYALRWWREDYFVYNDGIYEALPVAELKADIADYLRVENIKVATNLVGAILLCINSMIMVPGKVKLGSWLDGIDGADVIVAKNGNVSFSDIDPKTEHPKLLKHSASFFATNRLPYHYVPEAKCPLWETFVSQVMSENMEYVTLLQQWCGYLFRRDLREHRFLLMVGEGSNGKGVFCEIVEQLVGPANVSHVPLGVFDRPFALHTTLGKMVNITTESHHLVEEQAETQLKSFVAGDAMSFERKFRDPIEAVPTAKVVVSTNSLPRFNDKSSGLWRRVLLVPFEQTFSGDRRIPSLANELKRELPGILLWALDGLKSLNRNYGFSIPSDHEAFIEDYRQDSDPCRAFLLETYAFFPNAYGLDSKDVYRAYTACCAATGCRPMNERHFGQQVRRVFPGVERKNRGARGDRHYVYAGLTTREEAEASCEDGGADDVLF